jgi:hypothetical protein
MGEKDFVRAYSLSHTGTIGDTKWTSGSETNAALPLRAPDGMPGGFISVSSNGDTDGIVWVSVSPHDATYTIERGVLMAFSAETGVLLWADPDPSISFAKFVPPTIGGGKVFRAAFSDPKKQNCPSNKDADYEGTASCGSIVIYGLKDIPLVKKKPF